MRAARALEGAEHDDNTSVRRADGGQPRRRARTIVEVGDGVVVEGTARVPIGPFGETLTWPSPASGAVPTKNIAWRAIQARWCSSMRSKTLATRPI